MKNIGNVVLTAVAVVLSSGGLFASPRVVLELKPTAENRRNSEGDFAVLRDGRILFAYSRFSRGTGDDHDRCVIAARVSSDKGETWSGERVIAVNREGSVGNAMSASLLRLRDGRLALFYGAKATDEAGNIISRKMMQVSSDEGETWDPAKDCTADLPCAYRVLNNARVIRLSSGRVLIPVAEHVSKGKDVSGDAKPMCVYSDDDGGTWKASSYVPQGRTADGRTFHQQEPGVVELKDGRVMMWFRTNEGRQWLSYSSDGGVTWSAPEPSVLVSPISPATIRRLRSGELLCVWNDHEGRPDLQQAGPKWAHGVRTPLTVGLSADEGRTWPRRKNLETGFDPKDTFRYWYCYTAVLELDDRLLFAYCAEDALKCLRIVSVPRGWLPPATFRPPAVPLVTVDPMFSVWSPATRLTEAETVHWSLRPQPVKAWLEAGDRTYRMIGGTDEWRCRVLPQTGTEVRATQTVCSFENDALTAELRFSTPFLTEDLEVFSRPVTYLTVKYAYKDGKPRTTRFRFAWDGRMVSNDDGTKVHVDTVRGAFGTAAVMGRYDQRPLEPVADRVRPNGGYAWLVAAGGGGVGFDQGSKNDGAAAGVRPMVTVDFGSAARGERHLLLAYDDVKSATFLGREVPAWWRRGGKTFREMLTDAERDYPALMKRMDAFDAMFAADMMCAGGARYAALAALAYRQSFAACKLVADADGEPLYFSKENSSGGFIGTVDVFYPQSPLLLLAGKTLFEATLRPIMRYVESGSWPYPYAPHDVGMYPRADGQLYRTDLKKFPNDSDRMPVEECGNMLILFGAAARLQDNAAFAAPWKATLAKWAAYLEKVGWDPDDQLCTDDFAGHMAHNANLGIKSILALAAYADLAESWGDAAAAAKYRNLAKSWTAQWCAAAKGGAAGGTRLAFDRPGSWSMKYNLVWDRLLGYNLFPPEIAQAELKAYRALQAPYGLALDSRETYTKADWLIWSAALTDNRNDFDALVDPLYRFANETPDRVPLPDWYWTDSGRVRGFIARSVIGGLFMPDLLEKQRRGCALPPMRNAGL